MSATTPYIGSRISLISKNDVRYEGYLYGIDTKESEVYLQNVRCFGTEDRNTDNPMAATSEVYGYIIFRGSDIKDLQVCEPPPHPQMPSEDPNSQGFAGNPYGSYGMGWGMPPPYMGGGGYNPYAQYQYGVFGGGYGQPPAYDAQFYPGMPSQEIPPENNEVPQVQHQEAQMQEKVDVSRQQEQVVQPPPVQDIPQGVTVEQSAPAETPVQAHEETPTPGEVAAESSVQKSEEKRNRDNQHRERNYHQRGQSNRTYSGGRGGNNQYRRGRGQYQNSNRGHYRPVEKKPNYTEDFDFDAAAERFEKMKLEDRGSDQTEVEIPEEQEEKDTSIAPAYDAKSSFFDSLSCETLERLSGKEESKKSYHEVRKMDVETFGHSSVDRRNRGRRNYNRGNSYNRNHGNNNHNNNNNNYRRPYNKGQHYQRKDYNQQQQSSQQQNSQQQETPK